MGRGISSWTILSILLTLAVGCFGGSDIAEPPDISAGAASERAMELYDTNDDGAVTGDEFDRTPALKAALKKLDRDADGKVTADEIAARISAWQTHGFGSVAVSVRVYLDNEPLAGAKISFEPESFLGEKIQAGTGTTKPGGTAFVSVPRENRPDPGSPAGMYFGFYTVRICKIENGAERIPARYNSKTTLGQEIALDDPNMRRGIEFRLKSR